MRFLASLLLSLLTLPMIASATDQPATPPTLKSVPKLPADEIKSYYDEATWKVLSEMPITAYVIMRGPADRISGQVAVNKVLASFPNSARNEFAAELAKRVKLPYESVVSRVPATAEVFVIFYEPSPTDRQAIVYAQGPADVRYYDIIQYRAKAP